jgi:hypothetical protein
MQWIPEVFTQWKTPANFKIEFFVIQWVSGRYILMDMIL